MYQSQAFPAKKAFLYALIGSVALSAVLGVAAIFSQNFGWFQIRILLTTVTIAAASICGLACGAYRATDRGRILPLCGLALTLLAAAMIIAGMWLEIASPGYWKFAASAAVFAIACAHLALLSMARLSEAFQSSLVVAYAAIFGVAAIIVLMIVGGTHGIPDAGMFRLLGVATIVDAAITLVIPILHRLSKAEVAAASNATGSADTAAIDAEIAKLRARLIELERMKQYQQK